MMRVRRPLLAAANGVTTMLGNLRLGRVARAWREGAGKWRSRGAPPLRVILKAMLIRLRRCALNWRNAAQAL